MPYTTATLEFINLIMPHKHKLSKIQKFIFYPLIAGGIITTSFLTYN
jgi:hypothetical protein